MLSCSKLVSPSFFSANCINCRKKCFSLGESSGKGINISMKWVGSSLSWSIFWALTDIVSHRSKHLFKVQTQALWKVLCMNAGNNYQYVSRNTRHVSTHNRTKKKSLSSDIIMVCTRDDNCQNYSYPTEVWITWLLGYWCQWTKPLFSLLFQQMPSEVCSFGESLPHTPSTHPKLIPALSKRAI